MTTLFIWTANKNQLATPLGEGEMRGRLWAVAATTKQKQHSAAAGAAALGLGWGAYPPFILHQRRRRRVFDKQNNSRKQLCCLPPPPPFPRLGSSGGETSNTSKAEREREAKASNECTYFLSNTHCTPYYAGVIRKTFQLE